ncbi:MAG: hypothetical protein ACPG8W_02815, partial [Candidatus Promineifilaceae bacterium]
MNRSGQLLYRFTFLLLFSVLLIGCNGAELPTVALPSIGLGNGPADVVSDSAVKFLIKDTGVYRVSLSQLKKAGLTIDALSAENLNLSSLGVETPYLLDGDNLVFYGQATDSRYSELQPYILRSGAAGTLMADRETPALTSPAVSTVMQTMRLENNWRYEQRAAEFGGDVWFWERILDVG